MSPVPRSVVPCHILIPVLRAPVHAFPVKRLIIKGICRRRQDDLFRTPIPYAIDQDSAAIGDRIDHCPVGKIRTIINMPDVLPFLHHRGTVIINICHILSVEHPRFFFFRLCESPFRHITIRNLLIHRLRLLTSRHHTRGDQHHAAQQDSKTFFHDRASNPL